MTNVKAELYMITSKSNKHIKKTLIESNLQLKDYFFEENNQINSLIYDQDIDILKSKEFKITEDKLIILKSTNTIPKGNFYFPLNQNYKNEIKNSESKFLSKSQKKLLNDDVNLYLNYNYNKDWTLESTKLPDDSKTNCLILLMFNYFSKRKEIFIHDDFYEFLKTFFTQINKTEYLERMKKIYFRYKSKIEENSSFQYLSCKKGIELNYLSISETYKYFFCGICLKFNCSLHGIKFKNNYDNYNCYNLDYYSSSFKNLYNNTLAVLLEENEIKSMKTENFKNHSDNNFIQFLISSKNKFEDFFKINNLKFKNENDKNQIEKILEFNSKKKYLCEKTACSLTCYLKFLCSSDLSLVYEKILKNFTKIELMMIHKLFRIFKFDPCAINKSLKFIEKPSYISNRNIRKPKIRVTSNLLPSNLQGNNLTDTDILFEEDHLNCTKIYIYLFNLNYEEELRECVTYENLKSKLIDKIELKKFKNNLSNQLRTKKKGNDNQLISYKPCFHKGNEPCCINNCDCFERGFCEKYCACNKEFCKLRFQGCLCETGNCSITNCRCFLSGRECDHDLCRNCSHYDENLDKMKLICKNKNLQTSVMKTIGISESNIDGLGLFSLEKIRKGEFIGEYVGEKISQEEADRRDNINENEKSTYMFNLNNECIIDAKMMGNKIRFANHSKQFQNATTRIHFVNGDHRVGIFAISNIQPKQEIFFDYDGLNILKQNFSWVDDKIENSYVRNKRLRKKNRFRKNLYPPNTNETISIKDFRSKFYKQKRLVQRKNLLKNDRKEKYGDEIEIDIFDINK